jgi:hypothetical protein
MQFQGALSSGKDCVVMELNKANNLILQERIESVSHNNLADPDYSFEAYTSKKSLAPDRVA